MIFVTVGTHEQQFDRLVKAIDDLVAEGELTDDVVIQTGYSDYEPKHCVWSKFFPSEKMRKLMNEADVVVVHGGPSSIAEAMASGNPPVVVPRNGSLGEHVNNHQVEFTKILAERKGGIVPVYDVANLADAIRKSKAGTVEKTFAGNNASFCSELERLIKEL